MGRDKDSEKKSKKEKNENVEKKSPEQAEEEKKAAAEKSRKETTDPKASEEANKSSEKRNDDTKVQPVSVANSDGSAISKDDKGRVIETTDATGKVRKFEYNGKNEVAAFTDEKGKKWSSSDGKIWTSDGEKPKQMNVIVNKEDGALGIFEAGKQQATVHFLNGQNLVQIGKEFVKRDKDNQVVEAGNAEDRTKSNKFTYENGALKTITLADGTQYSTSDGTNFVDNSGRTIRNAKVSPDGTLTYANGNGAVVSAKPDLTETKIDRKTLEVSANSIAYAMNGGTGIGIDFETIKSELKGMNETMRAELKQIWKEKRQNGESNFEFETLEEEFDNELIKGNSKSQELSILLNRKEGKDDVPGRIKMALTSMDPMDFSNVDATTHEKKIRDLLATANEKQIKEYDQQFRDKNNGVGILESVQNNSFVSQSTKDAVKILMKGNDALTDQDTLDLTDIALRTKNMDLFQETMSKASDTARKTLIANGGKNRVTEAFGESQIAIDCLQTGKIGTGTEIRLNTSFFGDNEKAIDTAVQNMSPEERLQYLRGKQVNATMNANKSSSSFSQEDLEAYGTYRRINQALKLAGDDWEVNKWESRILCSKPTGDFINGIYAHRGTVNNSSVQDIAKTIEEMPEEVWKELKAEQEAGRSELRDRLSQVFKDFDFASDNDKKVADFEAIVDAKLRAQKFTESQTEGRRDVFTALDQAKGWDTDEGSAFKALQNMTEKEKQQYRDNTDGFRDKLDEKIKTIFGTGPNDDEELEAAQFLLGRVKNGQSSDDILVDLHIYASENSVNEADIVDKVRDKFRDKKFWEMINNPQTEEQKQYAQKFKEMLPKALGNGFFNGDYETLGKPLIETGELDVGTALNMHKGFFDQDEKGAYRSILYANEEETQKLLNDKSYQDTALHFLSSEEREVALNNLRERNRLLEELKKENLTEEDKKKYTEELNNLYKGGMRPEDAIRASYLGAGTDEDGGKEALLKTSAENMPQVLNDYARKYNMSMRADGHSELSGQDLVAFNNLLRRAENTTQIEDLIHAQDQYSESRGFGSKFVATVWDGTADQTDKEYNEFVRQIAEANGKGETLSPAARQKQLEKIATSIENLVESKEALGNVVADVAITAVAVGGCLLAQPESLGLLAFTKFAAALGVTSAALKVAIKQSVMGNNYTSDMMYADLGSGFTDGALNVIGANHIAALTRIGKATASRSAVSVTEKLLQKNLLTNVVREGVDQADKRVFQEVNALVRNAMANGADKFDDAAIKRAATRLVNKDLDKAAYDKAVEETSQIIKQSLSENVKLSQKALTRYLTSAAFDATGASVGGAGSGSVYTAFQFDSTKSLQENLDMIAKAGLTSAFIGGVAGGGTSTLLKGTVDMFSSIRRTSNDLQQINRTELLNEPNSSGIRQRDDVAHTDETVKAHNGDDPQSNFTKSDLPVEEEDIRNYLKSVQQREMNRSQLMSVSRDEQGVVNQATDFQGRKYVYTYQDGQLLKVDSPIGKFEKSGDDWYVIDGGKREKQTSKISVDNDGNLVMTAPSGSRRVTEMDGTTVCYDSKGRYSKTIKVDQNVQATRLEHILETQFADRPEVRQRLLKLMEDVEDRHCWELSQPNSQRSVDEVALTYKEVSRLLSSKNYINGLSPQHADEIAEQILFYAAHPSLIGQGKNPTCSVATVASRLFTRSPSSAARMITEVSISGKYVSRSSIVDMTHFIPDTEALTFMQTGGIRGDQNQRSLAGQIIQETMINSYWQQATKGPSNTAGNPFFNVQQGDLYYGYVNDDPLQGRRIFKRSTGEYYVSTSNANAPHLHKDDIAQAYNESTYGSIVEPRRSFYLFEAGRVVGDSQDTWLDSPESLSQALVQAQEEGRMPVIVRVNPSHKLMNKRVEDWSNVEDIESAHVVTIRSIDPVRGEVELINQWGKDNNLVFVGQKRATVKDLFMAMKENPGKEWEALNTYKNMLRMRSADEVLTHLMQGPREEQLVLLQSKVPKDIEDLLNLHTDIHIGDAPQAAWNDAKAKNILLEYFDRRIASLSDWEKGETERDLLKLFNNMFGNSDIFDDSGQQLIMPPLNLPSR